MLDRDPTTPELTKWIRSLPCFVRLPPGMVDGSGRFVQKSGAYDDVRQFQRFSCPGTGCQAALEYRQSLPALPREKAWFGVYITDLSRGGCGLLHSEPLYPGEQMRLRLVTGGLHGIEVMWCRQLDERCFAVGMQFVEIKAAAS